MLKLIIAIQTIAKEILSDEEATVLGEKVGIDWDAVDFSLEQFKRGYEEELEHGTEDPETNVTDDDPEMTAKIVWTHLKKNPTEYDDEVAVDACDYPRTDPVITRGSPGNPEDAYQKGPPQDSLMEPRWIG